MSPLPSPVLVFGLQAADSKSHSKAASNVRFTDEGSPSEVFLEAGVGVPSGQVFRG
jgi:hypothetical protein